MKTLDHIKENLSEQIETYHLFLDLLQKEKICLINLNAAETEYLSKKKDTILFKLKLLEEERVRLSARYASDNNLSTGTNLRELTMLSGDKTLNGLRLQLVSLLQSIAELNEFNKILIERSLHFVKNSISFIDIFGINMKRQPMNFSKEV